VDVKSRPANFKTVATTWTRPMFLTPERLVTPPAPAALWLVRRYSLRPLEGKSHGFRGSVVKLAREQGFTSRTFLGRLEQRPDGTAGFVADIRCQPSEFTRYPVRTILLDLSPKVETLSSQVQIVVFCLWLN
jgi:hypothetical protein